MNVATTFVAFGPANFAERDLFYRKETNMTMIANDCLTLPRMLYSP